MAKTTKHIRIGTALIKADDEYLSVVGPVPATLSTLAQVVSCLETTDVYQGPNVTLANGVFVRYGSTNTGYGYFSGATDCPSTARYELGPGDQMLVPVSNMNELFFASSTTDGTIFLAAA